MDVDFGHGGQSFLDSLEQGRRDAEDNPFRPMVDLTESQRVLAEGFRAQFDALYKSIAINLPAGWARGHAMMNLEQAYLWLAKAIIE